MSNHQTYEDVAVLIPCYNEEITIEKVVTDFKRELPEAQIWVFDNNSTDQTALRAKSAGGPSCAFLQAREGLCGQTHV